MEGAGCQGRGRGVKRGSEISGELELARGTVSKPSRDFRDTRDFRDAEYCRERGSLSLEIPGVPEVPASGGPPSPARPRPGSLGVERLVVGPAFLDLVELAGVAQPAEGDRDGAPVEGPAHAGRVDAGSSSLAT